MAKEVAKTKYGSFCSTGFYIKICTEPYARELVVERRLRSKGLRFTVTVTGVVVPIAIVGIYKVMRLLREIRRQFPDESLIIIWDNWKPTPLKR